MFRSTYQTGCISVFYSVGSDPLQLWDVQTGSLGNDAANVSPSSSTIERIMDEDLKSSVVDIRGINLATTFIQCPKKNFGPLKSLGITLPHLVFLIKNVGEPCSIEVQVMDTKNERRRFRASTFQRSVKSNTKITAMPLKLSAGWNHVQFNLDEFLYRWYSSRYKETVQIQVHATCRIRRIYFTERPLHDEELPQEFRLFVCRSEDTDNATCKGAHEVGCG